jgi:hypothetical protein
MIQHYQQQFRRLDFIALAYGLTGGVCLLSILIILGPGLDNNALNSLQKNSSDFFVRCNTNDCSSLITPFVAYLLNIEKNLAQLLTLWLAINIGLAAYLFVKLTQTPFKPIHAFAIAAIPYALVMLNVFNPSSLITILPCALSALLASVLYAQGGRNWAYFITGAVLFSLPMGLLLYGFLACYLMSTQESKQDRRDMLRLVHSIALGCIFIAIYLLLIEYNFLEWANEDGAKANLGSPILHSIGLTFSYLAISIAMISIHAKKVK